MKGVSSIHLRCKWNWEQSFWIRQCFIHTADLTNILFIQQRQGPDYHIIKVTLSTVVYCLKLKIHTNLPVCFVPVCIVLALHWETPLLLALGSAGGYSEQTFKALPSPYVHYDNLFPTILFSLSLPSSPVATILFLHQLAQWLIQQANNLEVKSHH